MALPRVDLINMDCSEFEGLPFVLTSPRSLEACRRLGIEPVTLLPQPLLPDAALAAAMSDRLEADRRRRLRLARLERERIIDEDTAAASAARKLASGDIRFAPESAAFDHRRKPGNEAGLSAKHGSGREFDSLVQSGSKNGLDAPYQKLDSDRTSHRNGWDRDNQRSVSIQRFEINHLKVDSQKELDHRKIGSEREQDHLKINSERQLDHRKVVTEREPDHQIGSGKDLYYRKIGSKMQLNRWSSSSVQRLSDSNGKFGRGKQKPGDTHSKISSQQGFVGGGGSQFRKAGSVWELGSQTRDSGGESSLSCMGMRKSGSERHLSRVKFGGSEQNLHRRARLNSDDRWLTSGAEESEGSDQWRRGSGKSVDRAGWRRPEGRTVVNPWSQNSGRQVDPGSTSDGDSTGGSSLAAVIGRRQRQHRRSPTPSRRDDAARHRDGENNGVERGVAAEIRTDPSSPLPRHLKELEQMRLNQFRAASDRRKRLEDEIDDFREEMLRLRRLADRRALDAVERGERATMRVL